MIDTLMQIDPRAQAAIISAVVGLLAGILGTPIRYVIDKTLISHKLKMEYEYEQKKKLRDLILQYRGRLLESAVNLNHRFWNLYENEAEGWLYVDGKYSSPENFYYFTTTVYRFLNFQCLARQFEQEAIYLDPRIAEKEDLEFVKLLKALHWVATDVALFKKLKYDKSNAKDHIFSDSLKSACDSFCKDGKLVSLDEFQTLLKNHAGGFKPVLIFFDGLKKRESRYRWDRVVSFHLILLAFINSFGYDMQVSSSYQFYEVEEQMGNITILDNLCNWLSKLGIDNQVGVKNIGHAALKIRTKNYSGPADIA